MTLTARFLPTPTGDHRLAGYTADDRLATLKVGSSPVLILPDRHPESMINALAAVGWQPADGLDAYGLVQVGDPYDADFAFEIEPIPAATPLAFSSNDGTVRIVEDTIGDDLVFEARVDNGVLTTTVTLRVGGEHIDSLHAYLGQRIAERDAARAALRANAFADAPVLHARFLSERATGDARIGLYDDDGRLIPHVADPDDPFLYPVAHSRTWAVAVLEGAGYQLVDPSDRHHGKDSDDPGFEILVKRVR